MISRVNPGQKKRHKKKKKYVKVESDSASSTPSTDDESSSSPGVKCKHKKRKRSFSDDNETAKKHQKSEKCYPKEKVKSDDSDSNDIERKVSHKVRNCKAATKKDRTHKKAKREVTSEDSNSDSEFDSESESIPVKGKKHKSKKGKKPENIDQSSTESPPDTESGTGLKPHRKLTLEKLTGTTKVVKKSKSKKPRTVSVPMDEWEAVMDFVQ